ncbi:DNA polymerase III subunit gamma/tau [Sedimentibacter sp. zth1]|uniref:DNA polymerase III subunit gamma/tau n=1 Tax=Sedimentibacter sp. zth1 TaxID=2816908 RepID=UPI001A90CE67|nr:DNA polymerase III subunit gamma/tau [Sedimentibacter sp. zth1]QSX05825.1 DNA polymerase III subunit gamma/tau [Sedimentibacter sp. zth1]
MQYEIPLYNKFVCAIIIYNNYNKSMYKGGELMSHQALYRRFRSKTFDEIIGQEHVVKTLKNQILSNNVAHAYLFCGIRGTGKTSTAKILARAVNCLNNADGNPCNECEICKSILNETNMDVVEMDAASNNGVDDIRELRDKVKFMPSKSKYKVYIIDEVHMLSKGAFNALLKTLEEPPEHLIFILATTEPQKIPATILSRCQRFDLRRITVEDTVKNMQNICDEIGVEIDEKALKLIAANSDGAMRDALSILDRCLTFGSSKIEYDDVNDLLGIVSFDNIIKVSNAIIDKNLKEIMSLININLNQGKDLLLFIEEIITYFRNMLLYKTTALTDNLVRMTEDNIELLKSHAERISLDQIISIIQKLSEALSECKKSINPRIIFEIKIISLMESSNTISNNEDINNLIKRVEYLESAIKNSSYVNINTKNEHVFNKKPIEKPSRKPKGKLVASDEIMTENNDIVIDTSLTDEDVIKKISNNWNQFLKVIRSENAGLSAIIRESKLSHINNKTIYFEYESKFNFHYTAANQDKNKSKLKEILLGFLKAEYNVDFILKTDKKNQDVKKSMDDVFEDMKTAFGEDKVELK